MYTPWITMNCNGNYSFGLSENDFQYFVKRQQFIIIAMFMFSQVFLDVYLLAFSLPAATFAKHAHILLSHCLLCRLEAVARARTYFTSGNLRLATTRRPTTLQKHEATFLDFYWWNQCYKILALRGLKWTLMTDCHILLDLHRRRNVQLLPVVL